MKFQICLAVVLLCVAVEGQNNFRQNNFRQNNNNNNFRQNNNNNFRPNNGRFNNVPVNNNRNNRQFNNNNRTPVATTVVNNNRVVTNNRNNNFRATPADRLDRSGTEIYPGCNGTVCLPDANLCAKRQQKVGHFRFGQKSYWVSWASDEQDLRNARWNWFTGRNYCRMMCMDMVSFETEREQTFVEGLMDTTGVKDVHTAGRLCDKEVEGCNQTRFQPLHINGWFWASTLKMMPPTNVISNRFFNNWATTGEQNRPQPDGELKADGFGKEACMALVNEPRFGGAKWHDAPCNTRRQLICEDLPVRNINFVRNQNPGLNIP